MLIFSILLFLVKLSFELLWIGKSTYIHSVICRQRSVINKWNFVRLAFRNSSISSRSFGKKNSKTCHSEHLVLSTCLLHVRDEDIGFQLQFFNCVHAYCQHYWIWHRPSSSSFSTTDSQHMRII